MRPRLRGLRVALPVVLRSKILAVVLLVVLPLPMYAVVVWHAVSGGRHGSDFLSFWEAGGRVLQGRSPYPALSALPAVADRLTFEPFVYPAPAAYAMTPLAVLPFALAATIFLVLAVVSVIVALRLLGVRDWRCHAAAFLSVPVVASLGLGTFSPLLLLGTAAAWHWRAHARLGLIVGGLVVAKLFLWPLGLWLLYTRRFKAAALAATFGLASTVVAWSGIGFAGLRAYPQLLSRLTGLVGTNSYSPFALIHAFGPSGSNAQQLVLGGGAVLTVLAAVELRERRDEPAAFVAALGLALLLTPILWPHYLVLLFVPIALVRRTFSPVWLLPLLMWFNGSGWSFGEPRRIVPFLVIGAVPFVLALRRDRVATTHPHG